MLQLRSLLFRFRRVDGHTRQLYERCRSYRLRGPDHKFHSRVCTGGKKSGCQKTTVGIHPKVHKVYDGKLLAQKVLTACPTKACISASYGCGPLCLVKAVKPLKRKTRQPTPAQQ